MQLSVKRDEQSAAFFDAAAEGTLLALQCDNCGTWVTPYVVFGSVSRLCRNCHSGKLEWQATSGSGTLVTWTLIPGVPAVVEGAPVQVSGIVELTEGPWLMCALDIPVGELAVGLAVRVGFARPGGGEAIPVFRAN
jgi:uncharacterized OB-fold protein